MIGNVYHLVSVMIATTCKPAPNSRVPKSVPVDAGIRALLDHVAWELATEFVRLMREDREEPKSRRKGCEVGRIPR